MKFLAVFAALVAVACASNTWTLQQLSAAIESPHTDAALRPHLVAAMDQMMESIWSGQSIETVTVTIPAESSPSLSMNEISEALQNPETDPALVPYLEALLNQMMEALYAGHPVEAAVVGAPAMEIHYYTLHELSMALQDSTTNPELIPYLEHALNTMMDVLVTGEHMEAIVIAVPAGLYPAEVPAEIVPAPVEAVAPVPAPVDAEVSVPVPIVPISPIPSEIPASPAPSVSPLVQIIVNVNQQ